MGIALDVVLAILVLAASGWTIVVRDSFSAAVAFVAYGLVLTLIWMRVAAPDIALTEAALGAGLTGGLMITASSRLPRGHADRTGTMTRWLAGALSVLVAAGLGAAVLILPMPPPTLARRRW